MNKFLSRTFLYFLSPFLVRVVSFLLIPIYTRFLTPEEYGIWGLTSTVSLFLNLAMSLGMLMAVGRFYFDGRNEKDRSKSVGTIFFVLTVFPLFVLAFLEQFGSGLFDILIPGVPYRPYLQLTAWATYFSIFSVTPLMVLRSREEAKKYFVLNVGQSILFQSLAIFLVVGRGTGVVGMLGANLIASFVFIPIYVREIVKHQLLYFSLPDLSKIIRYSFPLIPNGLAGWILLFSDRLILQRWVSLSVIGVYSLGYTLGMLVQNIGEAATNAWFPSFYSSENSGQNKSGVKLMASYIILGINMLSLTFIIAIHHFIKWFLPISYSGAGIVASWVAISGIFLQVYYLLSYSIHYSKRTIYISSISWTAALVNVILNILFIPSFGYLAAAVNTFVAYFVMAALSFLIAQKIYPVNHDYSRWLRVIGFTIMFVLISSLRPLLPNVQDVLYSLSIISIWLICLWFFGVISAREKGILVSKFISVFVLSKKLLYAHSFIHTPDSPENQS